MQGKEKRKTVFKDGRCQHEDGSPSYVRPYEYADKIPDDYIEFHTRYNTDAAEAWKATMNFRQKLGIWNILQNPSPLHRKMEAINPIFYHGHSKEGYPALWEIGKGLRTSEFAKISTEDHLRRVHYISEFGRNVLCEGGSCVPGFATDRPKDRFGVVFVMDIGDMDLGGYFGGGAFQLRCSSFDDLRQHWPQQARHAFVINVPSMLLSLARPILNGAMWGFTNKPQSVPPRMVLAALRTQLDDDQIPQEYGGSSPYKLGEHPYQLKMNHLLDEYLPQSSSEDDISLAKGEQPVIYHDNDTAVSGITPRETITTTTSDDNVVLSLLKVCFSFLLNFLSPLLSLVGRSRDQSDCPNTLERTYSSSAAALTNLSDDSFTTAGEPTPTGSEITFEVADNSKIGKEKKKRRRKSFVRLRRSIKRLSLKKIAFRRRSTDSPKDD